MTEQEWLECTDSYTLLTAMAEKGSDRKFNLFSIACCLRISRLFADSRTHDAIHLAGRHADGAAPRAELSGFEGHRFDSESRCIARAATHACCDFTFPEERRKQGSEFLAYFASCHAAEAYSEDVEPGWDAFARYSDFGPDGIERGKAAMEAERLAHMAILRDIFGNPFRSIAIDPRWLTATVSDLANVIYQERAFDRMPILADALMDSGCDNEEIIGHCRGPGPHVRGCWVIDLILAKE